MAELGCARLGDAINHGGVIIASSVNVLCNSVGVARLGDNVDCEIDGIVPIMQASQSVFCNGSGVARRTDAVACDAVIITGSENVFVGD